MISIFGHLINGIPHRLQTTNHLRPKYKGEKSSIAKTQLWGIFGSKDETTALITELALHSMCHPAGNRQDNNKLITVDTRADYTLLYPGFTQTLDKTVPSNPEKQIM